MIRTLTLLLLGLAVFSSSAATAAGKLQGLKLAPTRVELLGGRLSLLMPPGARLQARQRSIMAAAEPSAEETRVVVDAGEERLVLMTFELFALAGSSFEKSVREEVDRYWKLPGVTYAIKPLKLASGALRALAVLPSKLTIKGEAILLLGAFVASPDGTVQLLSFYVNPAAAPDQAGGTALARRILATLTPGKARLLQGGGPRQLAGLDPGATVRVTLPAGFVASIQRGPDFLVHRLRRPAPLGTSAATFGIYLGGHPSYQHRQGRGVPDKEVTHEEGVLLGKKVKVHRWQQPARPGEARVQVSEAMAPLDKRGTVLHLFLHYETPAQLQELQRIAATLAVGGKRKK